MNGLNNNINYNLDKLSSIKSMKNNFYANRNANSNLNNKSQDMFKLGAQRNRELNKRMDELSISGGISTGNLARNKIISSSSSFVEGSLPVISSSEMDSSNTFKPDVEDDPIIRNSSTSSQNYYGTNRSTNIVSNFRNNNNNF